MAEKIKIIDLFSGPGGLGEGFSAHDDTFEIAISIEKDISAQRTLKLRSFFRSFDQAPSEYYDFLSGKLTNQPEDSLYDLNKFKEQVLKSEHEARLLELGKDNSEIRNSIDSAIGNDECILIGGPPCQAYSAVGKAKNKGDSTYSLEKDPRSFLYKEYLEIVARYQPTVFVMENVKGMLSAKLSGKSAFERICDDLSQPHKTTNTSTRNGYIPKNYELISFSVSHEDKTIGSEGLRPKDYIIRCEDYGVPQKRHRVIIFGIRSDIAKKWSNDLVLTKHDAIVNIESTIGDLPLIRSGLSKRENSNKEWESYLQESLPIVSKNLYREGFTEIASFIDRKIPKIKAPKSKQGANFGLKKRKVISSKCPTALASWYTDERMGNFVVNHESKSHMDSDLHRYFFSSSWANLAQTKKWSNPFPKSQHYPESLKPNHKNFNTGKFADRFRSQSAHMASSTVTCHISKDGHAFIHYDPLQCRSFTVREAARIQTFPDNYFFVGTRTKQFEQVGNAVPPFIAFQIAELVKELFNR